MSIGTASEAIATPWSQRQPAPWLMRGFRWLQTLLALCGYALVFGFSARAAVVFWDEPWLGLLLGVGLTYLVVALHELGHVLGARVHRMHVLRAHVGWWDLKAMRRGWKSRWVAPAWNVDGAVYALPRSGIPLRRQEAWLVAGGPAANLATAVVAGLLAWALWRSGVGWVMAALAAQSAAVGLVNLIPSHPGLPNDGLQLWRLAKGRDESDPESVLPMLNGLCIEGVTPDQLPESLLDRLRQQKAPPVMVLYWFAFFARIHRGEWAAAVAMEEELDAAMAALPENERAVWASLASVIRTLMAIAEALHTGAASKPLDLHLPLDYDWFHPSLRMLCRALEAALAGDVTARDAWLAKAEAEAEQVLDAATRKSQRGMREAIRSRAGEPACAPFHPVRTVSRHKRGLGARALGFAAGLVQGLVVALCLLAGMVGGVFYAGMTVGTPLLGLALALPAAVLMACVHAWGGYAAARAVGAPVFSISVGPIELSARREGWRLRRRPFARWFSPALVAGLAPGRPERRQRWALALGGVVASGVAAALFAVLALAHLPEPSGWFWLCLAGPAAAYSFGRLVPAPAVDNAGAQVLRLLKPAPLNEAPLWVMRVRGITADGHAPELWPPETIQALCDQPAPGPLLALWLQVTSALIRGDAEAADVLGARLPSLLAADGSGQDPDAVYLEASLQLLRQIAAGLLARSVDAPLSPAQGAELQWRAPWLLPLAQALACVRAGDEVARDRELANAERGALEERDANLRKLAACLRDRIGVVPHRQNAAPGGEPRP